MALTLLLKEFMKNQEIHTPLLAITIDHRLRKESTAEADQVKKICVEKWNIHHITESCEWASRRQEDEGLLLRPRLSKMQQQARKYRYNLLQKVCQEKGVKCLFVAHNLGDQLETVLFRLGRASGINGLAGINSVSDFFHDNKTNQTIQLIRPLLSIPKKQLKETCERFNQQWIEDPSNDCISFDRIRIRKELERIEKEQGEEFTRLLSKLQKNALKVGAIHTQKSVPL
jgi:tRNA(Ile)-lysidine synthase